MAPKESTVSYSTKELFEQIKIDLTFIKEKLETKAESELVGNLADEVRSRAKQIEVQEITTRLGKLESEMATKEAMEDTRKAMEAHAVSNRRWMIGFLIPAILSTLGLLLTILLRTH